MLRNKYIWITLAAVAVILVIGGIYAFNNPQSTQSAEEPELQTTTVRRGDLVIFASGVGTLVPVTEVDLAFASSGRLTELYVRVGDQVLAGEILAERQSLESISSLQAKLASAEMELLSAQQDLQALYDNAAKKQAQAQLDLANASQSLEDAQYQRLIQQPGYRGSDASIALVEAELVLAEQQVEKAQAAFDKVAHKVEDDPSRANALAQLESAKANRDAIQRNLNWYLGTPSEDEQELLDAEVAFAHAQLEAAQRAYDDLVDGVDPAELAQAQARLKNAEAGLAEVQENLLGSVLTAPFDGIVTWVGAQAGENIGTSAIITLADLSEAILEIYLDETDLDKIDLDYQVEVVFDALPDEVFTGQVVQVDPSLTTVDGVPAIRALVRLDPTSFAKPKFLPIGASASVDVIGGRAENVLLVPVEALRELSPDEYAVFVMQDSQPVLRPVTVGLMDLTFAEITAGLEAGELVTTGIVETQ